MTRNSRSVISIAGSPMIGYSVTPRWKCAAPEPALDLDLADQIQPRNAAARVVLVAHGPFGDLGDHADDDRTAAQDSQKFPDGGLRSIGRHVGRAETDRDLRAADGVNASDDIAIGWRRHRCGRRRCGRGPVQALRPVQRLQQGLVSAAGGRRALPAAG